MVDLHGNRSEISTVKWLCRLDFAPAARRLEIPAAYYGPLVSQRQTPRFITNLKGLERVHSQKRRSRLTAAVDATTVSVLE
jgi:hypothetical protein